ncbi:MAG: hypothetical protein O7J95_08095 [Planctomycetota bacterium]|nr:hypothetical protein [Planctomycetota bacterium]
MRHWILLSGAALLVTGCELYEIPENGPGRQAVFEAARRVMLERYPQAMPVERSGLILLVTPVEMDGAYASRKKITVYVARNYTGAWEPRVRVEKHIEIEEPFLASDPDGESPGDANPAVARRWKPLMFLPMEEKALTDRILQDLGSVGGQKA